MYLNLFIFHILKIISMGYKVVIGWDEADLEAFEAIKKIVRIPNFA